MADHLLAVLREALTNAAKHAHAHRFSVTLSVDDGVRLEVTDDGTGIADPRPHTGGMGLANLAGRADKLGGIFEIHVLESGGTRLLWCVPNN